MRRLSHSLAYSQYSVSIGESIFCHKKFLCKFLSKTFFGISFQNWKSAPLKLNRSTSAIKVLDDFWLETLFFMTPNTLPQLVIVLSMYNTYRFLLELDTAHHVEPYLCVVLKAKDGIKLKLSHA